MNLQRGGAQRGLPTLLNLYVIMDRAIGSLGHWSVVIAVATVHHFWQGSRALTEYGGRLPEGSLRSRGAARFY